MSDAIMVAIITAGLSLIGTIITVVVANRQTIAALDKKSDVSDEKIQGQINVIKTEIETLSKRVEAHNAIVERTYRLEGQMVEAQHDIRDLKARKANEQH